MEGQSRSGFRRTRFIDGTELETSSDDNADNIFGNTTTAISAPTFAVLHDAVLNLGKRCKEPSVRIADPAPTLTTLTAEFNDLSRKMTLLKETIKATGNCGTSKKSGRMQTNSSSQALQAGNITEVATAKLVLHDCIAELISINHFLDGNEEIAAVYREKLRHAIADKYAEAETVVIQGISLAPNIYGLIPREGKPTAEEHHHFLTRPRKEAEIQTEAVQTGVIESLNDKSSTQPPDASASPKPIGEGTQQSKRSSWKNSRKWE